MAEQIPEAWIDEEVTISFGSEGQRRFGTLRSVTDRGIVVDVLVRNSEPIETYYPIGSVIAIAKGRPPKAEPGAVYSF
jgi:hypothetical protein